jgi:hypothetical protein
MADHQPNPRNPETSGCRTHFLPPDKLRLRLLLAALLALLLSIALLRTSGYSAEKDNAAVMKKASENLRDCFQAVKDERLRLGHPIDYDADVNGTGMLGDEYTAITTSHGNLEAKRSAANPNTAAMMVDLLARCGVKAGDTVACNFSSSFPTLNLATVCALDALGARGVIINSIGASTYGANLPDLTYPDMEHLLLENHQIKNHAEYFSAGGAGDQGRFFRAGSLLRQCGRQSPRLRRRRRDDRRRKRHRFRRGSSSGRGAHPLLLQSGDPGNPSAQYEGTSPGKRPAL